MIIKFAYINKRYYTIYLHIYNIWATGRKVYRLLHIIDYSYRFIVGILFCLLYAQLNDITLDSTCTYNMCMSLVITAIVTQDFGIFSCIILLINNLSTYR